MRPAVSCLLLASVTAGVNAQAPGGAQLFTGRDLVLVAGATAASVAISRLDSRIARSISDSARQGSHPGWRSAANRGSMVTETVLMIGGSAMYGVARLKRDDAVSDVALHATVSVASAALFIQVIRGALGRARPYVLDDAGETRDTDPYDFEFLHGFTSFNYRSYPSMHAMASMAVASALAQEMRLRDARHRNVLIPVLYGAATLPAAARMYLDEHWASDIAMGMFLGVYAGQKVVSYTHDHPDNRLDHALLRPTLRATITHDAAGFSLSLLPF